MLIPEVMEERLRVERRFSPLRPARCSSLVWVRHQPGRPEGTTYDGKRAR
jgi:hypothetical protein